MKNLPFRKRTVPAAVAAATTAAAAPPPPPPPPAAPAAPTPAGTKTTPPPPPPPPPKASPSTTSTPTPAAVKTTLSTSIGTNSTYSKNSSTQTNQRNNHILNVPPKLLVTGESRLLIELTPRFKYMTSYNSKNNITKKETLYQIRKMIEDSQIYKEMMKMYKKNHNNNQKNKYFFKSPLFFLKIFIKKSKNKNNKTSYESKYVMKKGTGPVVFIDSDEVKGIVKNSTVATTSPPPPPPPPRVMGVQPQLKKSHTSNTSNISPLDGADSRLEIYNKMITRGTPCGAVVHKMRNDSIDENLINQFMQNHQDKCHDLLNPSNTTRTHTPLKIPNSKKILVKTPSQTSSSLIAELAAKLAQRTEQKQRTTTPEIPNLADNIKIKIKNGSEHTIKNGDCITINSAINNSNFNHLKFVKIVQLYELPKSKQLYGMKIFYQKKNNENQYEEAFIYFIDNVVHPTNLGEIKKLDGSHIPINLYKFPITIMNKEKDITKDECRILDAKYAEYSNKYPSPAAAPPAPPPTPPSTSTTSTTSTSTSTGGSKKRTRKTQKKKTKKSESKK
jgi:hypothetical protein